MLRRTSLSTTLLIAVRNERIKQAVRIPAVPGIKVNIPGAERLQRSAHTVNGEGNIIQANAAPAMS